ncbi:DUF2975 domain-containing protein [Pseudonocardia alni subsp. carboxydivorans]|uniref:DUF2975 domain-containing protein n=1 Tax=Pseudonocardia alni subsp. carboxydivorans TaxID=415010 RepID=A0ABU9ADN2_PSEA5
MSPALIQTLRVALVLTGLGTLATQVILTATAWNAGLAGAPPVPGLLHVVAVVLAIGCVQVGLVAIWVLLSMVRRDAIFDERAFRWVPVLALSGLLAGVLTGAVCAHIGELDDAPGLILVGGGLGAAGIAFALLMAVMLGLLRNATALRRELEQVV